ncbi:hypothetical protein JOL79_25820 [Microbispora sp. RL4-1S]|uniref:Phosphotransferase n=1 Tax=Microbispora oryzae TaxID=2806554 RepID=A0A940WNQ7_9ACTN|nr:hypothetical protein [Microbispora oryzae]MBP2707207.1 hypothetical protein [Microbispora oryzae]
MTDAQLRLRYLDEVLRLLYPSGGGRSARTVLPHRLAPRRVVPRARWHAALGRPVLVSAGPDTIETYLGDVLGRRVHAVVRVRPARRPNRKPILEAHGDDGLVGFVKIGDSERAARLVRHESEVLHMLAGRVLKVVAPPTVLHHGVWRGLDVLVISPLPVTHRTVPAGLFNDAVREIASLGTEPGETPFPPPSPLPPPLPYAPGLGPCTGPTAGRGAGPGAGAETGPASGPGAGADAGAAAEAAAPSWHWHGDLSPWNVAAGADGRLLVWDWERFAGGVPLGFDALHHFFHRALRRMRPPQAARACLARSGTVLEPFGISPGQARRTAVHYLLTLADRHYRDGHEPLGPPSEWLNPLVDHLECLL